MEPTRHVENPNDGFSDYGEMRQDPDWAEPSSGDMKALTASLFALASTIADQRADFRSVVVGHNSMSLTDSIMKMFERWESSYLTWTKELMAENVKLRQERDTSETEIRKLQRRIFLMTEKFTTGKRMSEIVREIDVEIAENRSW